MIDDDDQDSGFRFDARRWTPREKIAGAGSLALLISLFLPWFGVSVLGAHVGGYTGLQDSTLLIVLVVVLAIGVLLVLRAGLGRVPFAPPPGDAQLLAGAAWLNLLVVVVAFLIKPEYTGQAPGGVSISWLGGAYLGLAAAVVAAASSGLPRLSRLPWPPPRRQPGDTRRAGDSRDTP